MFSLPGEPSRKSAGKPCLFLYYSGFLEISGISWHEIAWDWMHHSNLLSLWGVCLWLSEVFWSFVVGFFFFLITTLQRFFLYPGTSPSSNKIRIKYLQYFMACHFISLDFVLNFISHSISTLQDLTTVASLQLLSLKWKISFIKHLLWSLHCIKPI